MALNGRHDQVLTKHAVFVRQAHGRAHEAHVQAVNGLPDPAILALPAGLGRIDRNKLPKFKT